MVVSCASPRRTIRQWPIIIQLSPRFNTTHITTPTTSLPLSLPFVYANISVNCSHKLSVPFLTNRWSLFFASNYPHHVVNNFLVIPPHDDGTACSSPEQHHPSTMSTSPRLSYPSHYHTYPYLHDHGNNNPSRIASLFFVTTCHIDLSYIFTHYACTWLPHRIVILFLTIRTMLPSVDMLSARPSPPHDQNHAPFRGHAIC